MYVNYITGGGPIPLKTKALARLSVGTTLWCAICQVAGQHVMDNCLLLQKFIQTPQQLFCNFYKSMGHDERHCQSYELMMERTPTYQMQVETWPPDQGTRGVCGGYQGRG